MFPLLLPRRGGAGRFVPLLLPILFLVATVAGIPFLIGTTIGQHSLLALGVFGLLLGLLLYAPYQGVLAVLIYLSILGGLRRWMIPLVGWTGFDSLVLVGPVLGFLAAMDIARKGLLARGTWLSRLLFWLLLVMTAQILNPRQGGLAVGLGGALFYIAPLLWFYVGNALGPLAMRGLFRVAIGISLIAAVYGLYQTFYGLFPVEQEWVRLIGEENYNALFIDNGVVRAFAFFTSSEEYAQFLGIGVVLLWAAFLKGQRLALVPVPLLAVAIFLESSRGTVVTALFACTMLWAAQGKTMRSWLPRGAIAAAIAVGGLVWSMGQVQHHSFDSGLQTAAQHQAEGLLHPLDSQHSTASTHYGMLTGGFSRGFSSPLGEGLGATTLAGSKFGDSGANTEVDLSNMFVSLGFVGGLLYAAVMGIIVALAFRYWHRTRTLDALRTLGILALLLGQWLNGGYYATAMFVWLCIGAMHRVQAEPCRPRRKNRARLQGGSVI